MDRPAGLDLIGSRQLRRREQEAKESRMLTILLVIAVLMLLGVLPTWRHSRSWGYAPSGGLGLVVLVLVVLLLSGRM